MKRMALWLLLLSQSVLSHHVPISPAKQLSVQPEEYAVYSVLSQKLFITDEIERVVIERRIPANRVDDHKRISDEISWKFSQLEPSTIDDYVRKAKVAAELDNLIGLPVKYVLIEPKEVEDFFKKGHGRWEAFYKKYPKSPGLLAFSRVGFNQEKNQALVYARRSCGSLCGEGTWILLAKEAGAWTIRNQYTNLRS